MSDASELQVTESDKAQMLLAILDASDAKDRAMAKYKLLAAQSMSPLSENPHTLNTAIDKALFAVIVANNDMLDKIELLKAVPDLWETFESNYKIIKEKKDADINGEDDKGELQVTESDKAQMLVDILDASDAKDRAMAKYKLLAAQSMSPLSENPHTLNTAIGEALFAVIVANNDMLDKIELLKAVPDLWETFESKYKIIKEKKDADINGENDKGELVDK